MQVCQASECTAEFEAKRSTALYCSTTCRSRAARARKSAEAAAEIEAAAAAALADEPEEDGPAEHALVKAARAELRGADVLNTVNAQLALQFARQLVKPDTTGLSQLSKEFRSLMEAALAASTKPPAPAGDGPGAGGTPAPTPTPLSRAREARDAKLAAAGQEADRA